MTVDDLIEALIPHTERAQGEVRKVSIRMDCFLPANTCLTVTDVLGRVTEEIKLEE